ncbi:phosphopantothenoylcysteine synthetase decarboxylase [Staphylococcus gallinarum]|uniref:Phosphopantothenoylcysteine synthetase decarboxylase n=1 Tax=Staphylococcus gallinarum TaxID=1293 RepID=A0A380FFD9_STAGA|nr:phosphopantothenoylcysteine synthetase decarboxylase [Staphylococcus gallinarum]
MWFMLQKVVWKNHCKLFERLNMFFDETLIDNSLADSSFNGKHALITAGPTIEELDPVRYLSNRSSR